MAKMVEMGTRPMDERSSAFDLGLHFGQVEGSPPSIGEGPERSLIAVRRANAPTLSDPTPAAMAVVGELLSAAGLTAPTSSLRLTLLGSEGQVVEFFGNPDGTVLVGRDWETVDLVCTDPSVSRRHARVRLRESGEPVIEDLASSNGTWIERQGQRIAVPAGRALALEDGDRLGTSDDVVFAQVGIREMS